MLRVRLIPILSLKDGRIIKTVRFDRYRDVGHPLTTGKVFDSQDVDELILLDITATQERREPDWHHLSMTADMCSMPLTIGGGISELHHIQRMLQIGADKVTINTAAARNPDLVKRAVARFGSECIVVSMDVFRSDDGTCDVLVDGGYASTGMHPVEFVRQMEACGAGEILCTAIHRDGTMLGYDMELTRDIVDAVDIPVIANGGAGLLSDLVDVVNESGASAVAASSLFAFTDNKPIKARAFMLQHQVHVRPV